MLTKEEFRKYVIKNRYAGEVLVDDYIAQVENMTRAIIEERTSNFREVDVFSRLIMDRIIFLGTSIDDHVANIIVAQLLFLESTDADEDIILYINSPGGVVYAGLGIYDTMQYVSPDIVTICTGLAASLGAVLLAGGTKGKRSALSHARIMIHQPLGGAQGQASDMEITIKQIIEIKKDINEILAKHTGQDYESIERHAERDYWMNAPEAQSYGVIDTILESKKKSNMK